MADAGDTVRLDKWLWAARFFRTRNLAREAIAGGKVEVAGRRVKPGRTIRVGDRLSVQRGDVRFDLTVRDVTDRRVSAELAAGKYEEDPESVRRRERQAEEARLQRRERAARPRRPDKRERRRIVKFTRRGE